MTKGTPTYFLNLMLETEPFQDHILDKRFEIGIELYNSVLNVALKRYYEMVKTKLWRENQKNIADVYESEKDSNKARMLCMPYFKIRKDPFEKQGYTEEELVEDVLSAITVFLAKLYGSRSHKNKNVVDGVKKLFSEKE